MGSGRFTKPRTIEVALNDGGSRTLSGTEVVIIVGTHANRTRNSGPGVKLDARGFIQVNERLEAGAPGTWAIGERAGSPLFTHFSVDDFQIVRDNMAGGNRRTNQRQMPYVMFTEPPLARIGLSEDEAAQQGIPVRVSRLPMSRVLRTQATDEKQGWIKAVVSADDDQMLGFRAVLARPESDEVVCGGRS